MKRKTKNKKYSDGLEIFGGFENLLHSQIMRHANDNPMDFISGLYEGTSRGHKQGYQEGLYAGAENTIKSFITSGDKQFFVTDKNIYPFSTTESLYQNEDTYAHIKEFIMEPQLKRRENIQTKYNQYEGDFKNSIQAEIEALKNPEKITKKSTTKRNNNNNIVIEDERINYLTNTPIDKLLQEKINEKVVDIKNKMRLVKGTTMNTSISDFATSNEEALKILDEKYKLSTPNKNDAAEEKKRNELKGMINNYNTLYETSSLKKELDEIEIEIRGFKDKTIQKEFSKKRNRETNIFLTDNFSIYNIDNIRKLYPKNVEDVLNKIEKSKDAKIDISKAVSDFRTYPIHYNDIKDYIEFPTLKTSHKDVFDDIMNKKFNNNIPTEVNNYILALKNHKY